MKGFFTFLFGQSVFFNVFFFGVMIYGVFISIPQISVERYPNIDFGEVVISTSYPGASSQDVERLVTEEIESAIQGMNDVEFVRSSSKTGYSSINIKFIDDTDYESLYDELRLRVLGIQNRLPSINGKPLTPDFNVTKVDDWLPVIQVNLMSSDTENPLSKRALGRLAEELQLRLEQIPEVQEVKLNGKEVQQYALTLDPEAMRRYRVGLPEVQAALLDAGGSLPAGKLDTPSGERIVLVDDLYRTADDLEAVVVRKGEQGDLLFLSQLLKSSGLERMSGGVISSVNGRDTVSCQVVKTPRGNAKDIKQAVLDMVEEFKSLHAKLPIQLNTTLDSTVKIDDGLGVLQNSLGMALILVMLAIFLFLSSSGPKMQVFVFAFSVAALIVMVRFHDDDRWTLCALALNTLLIFYTCKTAVLTVSGIAFSFIGCLTLFQVLGTSLNEITLLGFVLTSGIIVDDAIVILENIQRHRDRGLGIVDAAILGTSEVFWPVISASLTTMAAFLPMLLMSGAVGDFFSLIPVTVSMALFISLIECLSIMPIHAIDLNRCQERFKRMSLSRKLKTSSSKPSGDQDQEVVETTHQNLAEQGIMVRLTAIYDRSLEFCLRNRSISLAVVFLLFVMAIGVLVQSAMGPSMGQPALLKLKFFPDDTSNIQIQVQMSSRATLPQTDAWVRDIAQDLMSRGPSEIKSVTANAGLSVDSSYKPIFGSHLAFMIVELPARDERSFVDAQRFIDKVRDDLEAKFEVGGIDLEISAQKDGPPVGAPIHVRVAGVSEENVVALGADLFAWMNREVNGGQLKGLRDLKSDRSHFSTVIHFDHDARRVAELGLSHHDVRFFAASLFEGAYVGDLRLEEEDLPIKLKLALDEDAPIESALSIPLSERWLSKASGAQVEALYYRDLGRLSYEVQPSSLERRDFQRTINVTANIREDALLQAHDYTGLISQWYRENAIKYPGATVAFGGEAESTAKSYSSLISAFFVSIFIIYGILAVQFKSYSQPFLIMANILFSFTGVILMTGVLGLLILLLPEGMVSSQRAMITVQSFIAMLGLTGLVVNDAIVLIDFINQQRRQGATLDEAVRRGAHHRVRPIIMTTWSTIAGLLPLAIGIPHFSITWGPFATCFVAGLTMSTLMTLLIIPVLYHLLESFKQRFLAV